MVRRVARDARRSGLPPSRRRGGDRDPSPPRAVLWWHVHGNDSVVLAQLEEITTSAAYLSGVGGARLEGKKSSMSPLRVQYVLAECPAPRLSPGTVARLRATPRLRGVARPTAMPCRGGRRDWEFPTLVRLHRHCRRHPRDLVGYVHTKSDALWRRSMQRVVLGRAQECAACIAAGGWVCGNRFAPGREQPCPAEELHPSSPPGTTLTTWCHFSGNMWWAACAHVAALRPPLTTRILREQDAEQEAAPTTPSAGNRSGPVQHGWLDTVPYGRFYAEYWIMNGPREGEPVPRHVFSQRAPRHRMFGDQVKVAAQRDGAEAHKQRHKQTGAKGRWCSHCFPSVAQLQTRYATTLTPAARGAASRGGGVPALFAPARCLLTRGPKGAPGRLCMLDGMREVAFDNVTRGITGRIFVDEPSAALSPATRRSPDS